MTDIEKRINEIIDKLPGPIGHPGWEAAKATAKRELSELAESHAWSMLMENG